MNDLLLEIGTEEIPADYIEPALNALSTLLLKRLTESRIEHGDVKTFGTPRRLAVKVADVAGRQKPLTTDVTGPPAKVGFDENGMPTIAAKKFAEKLKVAVNSLTTIETEKGSYLCARKIERGNDTRSILKGILPDLVLSIPFPKKMKWADLSIEFARPIHSILALFGDKVITFVLGNVKSGRYIFGHSFMNPGRIRLSKPDEYVDALRLAHVLVDLEERKKQIVSGIDKAAREQGGRVLQDDDLVDIVNNLVEYPAIVAGSFDKAFLEIPQEVLITAMREHQKYFAVIDKKNNLMPFFIAVNNTSAKDMALVSRGHERVLRARLEDAQFFYRSDLEKSLEDLAEKLKGVLFQARLGSVYEKVIRVQKLAEFLTDAADFSPDVKKDVSRAAFLCKADLVSQIVIEFPKLQGVMGRVYAVAAGESDTAASAIEEHYRPAYSGGPLPKTDAGAVLSIADKIDTICGCFSIDLIPTGTADPYALRRQGIGVIQIMLDKGFSFPLSGMIAKSLELFEDGSARDIKEKKAMIYTFLQSRIANLLSEQGFSKDVIAAVIAVSIDHIPNVWNRVRALEQLKTEPGFEQLAVVFKRVVNIIKKADHFETKEVDEDLFQDECERVLFSAYNEVKKNVTNSLEKGFFDQAMLYIASLRDSVDAFFDGVLVMAKDVRIRNNRLALLKHIADLFGLFADFSKI